MATISRQVRSDDGNVWYYEQRGSGPHLVLVPSGEGDCSSFEKTAAQLGKAFTVTTFDMPGMSRSVPVPPEAVTDITGQKMARQVMSLMDKLDIQLATFYGCSSGAAVVLYLQALFPDRVRNVLAHEMPMPGVFRYYQFEMAGHDAVAAQNTLNGMVEHWVGDRAAWDALGPEYHARVLANIPVWLTGMRREFMGSVLSLTSSDKDMTQRPVDWSLGGWSPVGLFWDNVEVAHRVNIPISVIPSRHFPQITNPEMLADHILTTTKKYL